MIISNKDLDYKGDYVSISKEHTHEIISGNRNEERVIMAGGDGTASTGLDAFLKNGMEEKTFGIYPLGSGNDFALNALDDKVRKVDVGYYNNDHFLNIFGMGLVADVVERAGSYQGMSSRYKLAAMRSLFGGMPSTRIKDLEINGEKVSTEGEYSMFMLMNTEKAGNGMRFNPEGNPYDGTFEFFALRKDYPSTLWMLLNLSLGRPTHLVSDKVLYRRGVRRLSLENEKPLPAQKDGETLGYMDKVDAGFYKKVNMFRYFKED
ncbi:MAG: diacylglycerol/lipid kinase family protein [Nanobdellota archaeon]